MREMVLVLLEIRGINVVGKTNAREKTRAISAISNRDARIEGPAARSRDVGTTIPEGQLRASEESGQEKSSPLSTSTTEAKLKFAVHECSFRIF